MTDRVLPFQTETSQLRGRLIRLGPLLDHVLSRHPYPEPVARLLGETLALAVALASTLKYDGIFTLQIKGDGPVSLIVADIVGNTESGQRIVRGYARFDGDAVAKMAADPYMPLMALPGKGWLAFTVDQGAGTERYQGIVALRGTTLAECARHYFQQSEQLPTGLTLAINRDLGLWRGAALLVQRLPESGEPSALARGSADEDDWRRTMVLMGTLTAAEMLDPALADGDLLFRLFHEDGVRVFEAAGVAPGCRCSREKVATVLRTLNRADVESLREDGMVSASCEFCNAIYSFDDDQLAALYASRG